jgi:parvulin-like peptidyl-prolyl isomerase
MIIVLIVAGLALTVAIAQQAAEPAEQPAEDPAGVAVPGPAEAPQPPQAPAEPENADEVLAKVGQTEITRGQVYQLMDQYRVPPAQREQFLSRALDGMIAEIINDKFMAQLDVEAKKEDIDKIKEGIAARAKQVGMTLEQALAMQGMTEEDLVNQARIQALVEKVTAEKKVDAYLEAHPGFFDGSGITAKVLFLPSAFTDETKKQVAAREQLAQIAKKVRQGKTTLDKAAESDKELDLQTLEKVTFLEITPLIGAVAFDLEPGKISDPIRFPNGLALVQVEQTVSTEQVAQRREKERKEEMAEKAKWLLSRNGGQASEEEIQTLLNQHADYVDGTEVTASHILLKLEEGASDEKVAEARKKLEDLAKKIRAEELTFAEAAKEHSACPSSAQGGDLGAFTYDRMVGPFSKVAFDTEVGKIAGPVRTQFGLHLIKVTDRSEPAKPGEPTEADKREKAKEALMADLQKDLFDVAMKNPVVIYYEPPAAPELPPVVPQPEPVDPDAAAPGDAVEDAPAEAKPEDKQAG